MSDITAALILDDSGYTAKIAAATAAATKLGSSLSHSGAEGKESLEKIAAASESLKSKMEMLGAAIVGVGLIEFAKASFESTSAMVDLANVVGISTQAMMEFNLSALAAGKTGDDVANMMQKMNLAAQNAAEGNVKARDSLNELGLTNEYLRTHTTEEAFMKGARALGEITDSAKRASLALDFAGKQGTKMPWKDFVDGVDLYKGSQKEAAEATEAAKKVMDDMAVAAQEVRNQFVLLADPVMKAIAPMTGGLEGAKIAAYALAGAMTLFAGSATITAIGTIKDAVLSLATSFGLGGTASRIESTAIADNTRVTLANAAAKAASLKEQIASYEMSIANAKATLAQNTAEGTSVAITADLSAARRVLYITETRLVQARAELAGTTAMLATEEGIATGTTGALAGAEVVATGATLTFAKAWDTLKVAIVTTLGPIGLAVAAATAAYSAFEAAFGSEHGVFRKSGDQSGANWISDMFGITDRAGDEAAAKLAAEKKKVEDEAGKSPVLSTKEIDINGAAIQGLKNQTDVLVKNNQLAVARLQLETELAEKSDLERTTRLAAFDAQSKTDQEHLRIQGQIKVLSIELANATKINATDKMQGLGAQITALKQQDVIQSGQPAKIAAATAELTKATNAQKMKMYYTDLDNKLLSDKAALQDQINQIGMTGNEKSIDGIKKQIQAAIDGAIKLKAAQQGGPVTESQRAEITQTVTEKYKPMEGQQAALNAAIEAGKIRVFYEDEAFKIATNIRDLKMSTDELTMTSDEIKLNAIKRQADSEIDAYVKMRAESIGLAAAESERASITAKINGLHAGEIAAMQQLIDKSRSFDTGWTKAWKDYNDAATNASQRASEMFGAFSNAFESAFDQMVRTGKVSWNSLLQDMVASMMKSDVKRMFADLTAGTAGGSSSILGAIGSLFHASGGDIPAGQVGIVGEVRPEVVTGPARVGPTSGSGSGTNVTYNINAVDAKSFQSLVAADPSFIYAVTLKGQRMLPGGA